MMKPIFRGMLAICSLFGFSTVSAQTKGATIEQRESGRTTTPSVSPLRQGFIMRQGKIMVVLPKGYAPLTQTRTFPNGATLQTDGTLVSAAGEKISLQEGDRLDMQGNLTRSPVLIQKSTTISGDTTGFGNQLLQAQARQQHISLLERKRQILEKKIELLEGAVKDETKAAELQKLDAEIVKIQKQLAVEEKK